MSSLPKYRQVFVVSDLHLGGFTGRKDAATKEWLPIPAKPGPLGKDERSFRIFRDAPALSHTITEVAKAAGPVALVLNGDIVDFLADAKASLFDPEGALAKLKTVINDPEQHSVWLALIDYLKHEAHDLVLVLGNHDIELGMADVQEWLATFLTEGDAERRLRLIHCYDGQGFECIVGGNLVQCVHGNGADPWNVVDYAQLAKVAEARRLQARVPELKANTGTTLVIEHMNPVKHQFQWVDLLKPEREGAAAVIQVKDRGRKAPIQLLAKKVFRPGMLKQLFIDAPDARPSEGETLRAHDDLVAPEQIDQWLNEAQERDGEGVNALELTSDDGMLEAVYVAGRSIESWLGKSLRELLLEGICSSQAWNLSEADDVFKGQDKLSDPDVDFLIVGHTHLERCLRRDRGRGIYYNSGTWIKLVRIPVEALRTDDAFKPVDAVLSEGSLEALEKPLKIGPGREIRLLQSIRTLVSVWADKAGASAALFHVEDDGGGGFRTEEVPNSRRNLDSRGLK